MKQSWWKKEFLERALEEESRPLASMDKSLSSRLTSAVRKSFRDDYADSIVLVRKKTVDLAEVEDCAYGVDYNSVEMGSQRYGHLMYLVLTDAKLDKLKIGVKMVLDHERGHSLPDRHSAPKSEFSAQKYAVKKSKDPLSGIAAIVAFDEFIKPVGVEKRLDQYLGHWREHWNFSLESGMMHDTAYKLPKSKALVKPCDREPVIETSKYFLYILKETLGDDWSRRYARNAAYPDLEVLRRLRK